VYADLIFVKKTYEKSKDLLKYTETIVIPFIINSVYQKIADKYKMCWILSLFYCLMYPTNKILNLICEYYKVDDF
jgi:hypothetical protein